MEIKEMQSYLYDLAEKAKDKTSAEILRQASKKLDVYLPVSPKEITSFKFASDADFKLGICPVCGATCSGDMKHCDGCGQVLDWTSEDI